MTQLSLCYRMEEADGYGYENAEEIQDLFEGTRYSIWNRPGKGDWVITREEAEADA